MFYEISHNLVQQETLVLPDGRTQRGFVHRKGATRALPAGHPDLVGTQWETHGPSRASCRARCSRRGDSAIRCEGAYGSGCSVNHGAGRVMARGASEARARAAASTTSTARCARSRARSAACQIRGIVGNTEHTPLDECGHVYKNLDAVLRVLEDEGIARVAQRLYPVANIKGTD